MFGSSASGVMMCCLLLVAAAGMSSCDEPGKHSLRELSKVGIEPSGKALMEAVAMNDVRVVGLLLDVGVHTEHKDEKGRTPLRIAVERGYGELFEPLLAAGASVEGRCNAGVSLLGIAMHKNDMVMMERLIKEGAKAEGVMPSGVNLLEWAVLGDRVELVGKLLDVGADLHWKDKAGNPMIHVALAKGQREMVDLLIERGADVSVVDGEGKGLLYRALEKGWRDMMPVLAAAGADPNLVQENGMTLLGKAILEEDAELVKMMMGMGAKYVGVPPDFGEVTPLDMVMKMGEIEMIEVVMGDKKRLEGDDWGGYLWEAYAKDQLEMGRYLLSKGVRAEGNEGYGRLMTEDAAIRRRHDWVKLLMDYGHDAGDSIYYVSSNGDFLGVCLLLSYGARPDHVVVPLRESAFMVALRKGHDRVAAEMVRHLAGYGRLPLGGQLLHRAIVTGNAETVRELLAAGADANDPTKQPVAGDFLELVESKDMKWFLTRDRNITPLMLAANVGDLRIARHLLEAGASKNAYTRVNKTWPINFASRRDDVPMMRLFLGKDPYRRERHIVLSLEEQQARIYNEEGEEIFSTKVSTGKKGFATRQGDFVITNKHRHHKSNIYDASMPYFQRLSCGDFGFHYGHVQGYPASHGCIRLPMASAIKLFAMTEVGDTVRIDP